MPLEGGDGIAPLGQIYLARQLRRGSLFTS